VPVNEPVYNLFLYVEGGFIKELGVSVHQMSGTDQEKLSKLQSLVDQDYGFATRFPQPKPLEWREYEGMARLGRQHEIFEEAFRACGAPAHPLVVVTPIVDGSPRIMAVTGIGKLDLEELHDTPAGSPGAMVDYLKAYVHDGKFDIPALINDDYFKAIKLLFNEQHYVSAAKLLMSFLDTIAFIELGDVRGSFVTWLQKYADLRSVGVTAEELWEFRNGLLHMTNLHSRAVIAGRVDRLVFFVGNISPLAAPKGEKYFKLKELIDAIVGAISRWIQSYNDDRSKIVDFVSRYDLTISDSRVAFISVSSEQ